MPLSDRIQLGAGVLTILAVLAGLFVRGRAGSCWSFVVYLCAVALSDALSAIWPERFYRRDFWMFKQSVHNLLKLVMVGELMVRIFRPYPSAYAAARRAVMAVLLGLAVLVGISLSRGTDYLAVVGRLYPHVNDGTVWLFIALGGCCLWYHLPLDPVHKAILFGLVPYLLVYSVVMRALVAVGWERGDIFNETAPMVWRIVIVYWAFVAWRRGPAADDPARRVSQLLNARRPKDPPRAKDPAPPAPEDPPPSEDPPRD